MIPWQLHEFQIAPGQRERFLSLWRTRLMPLADRHGPCIAGCWTDGEDRFVWLTSCEIRRTDDALAEDWPAMLGRHLHLGEMDVSCVLSETDFSPLGPLVRQAGPPLPHAVYELAEETLKSGGADQVENLARDLVVPLARDVGKEVVGVWRCESSDPNGEDRVVWMFGYQDEGDRKAKNAAYAADPRAAEITKRLAGVLTESRSRVLEPCDFSPLGPA